MKWTIFWYQCTVVRTHDHDWIDIVDQREGVAHVDNFDSTSFTSLNDDAFVITCMSADRALAKTRYESTKEAALMDFDLFSRLASRPKNVKVPEFVADL